jgi:hypothetical protein
MCLLILVFYPEIGLTFCLDIFLLALNILCLRVAACSCSSVQSFQRLLKLNTRYTTEIFVQIKPLAVHTSANHNNYKKHQLQ